MSMNKTVAALIGLVVGAGAGFGGAWMLKSAEVDEWRERYNGAHRDRIAQVEAVNAEREAAIAGRKADIATSLEPLLNQACREAQACRFSGECGYVGAREFQAIGHCAPLTDADCAASEQCKWAGDCGVVPEAKYGLHRCKPTKDEHCAGADTCTRSGKCKLVGAECVKR